MEQKLIFTSGPLEEVWFFKNATNCLGHQCYYLIRHGGMRFNIYLGEVLCLCRWIFTGAAEVKILSQSPLFLRLDFLPP